MGYIHFKQCAKLESLNMKRKANKICQKQEPANGLKQEQEKSRKNGKMLLKIPTNKTTMGSLIRKAIPLKGQVAMSTLLVLARPSEARRAQARPLLGVVFSLKAKAAWAAASLAMGTR
jgi:hypothetical protein